MWKRAIPLSRASPGKMAEIHLAFIWEISGPSRRAESSAYVFIDFSCPLEMTSPSECVYMENFQPL